MKKSCLLSVVFLCLFSMAHAALLSTKDQNVYLFGKVWGFLKYYHPEVTSGNFDWDQQFTDHYGEFRDAADSKDFNARMLGWLQSLGDLGGKAKTKNKDYFDKNFDLSWISESAYFTNDVTEMLNDIVLHRGKDQYYVKYGSVQHAIPSHEKTYDAFPYDDEAYRVMGLFSYWNFVEYFYPYKYAMDRNWDETLRELLPDFMKNEGALAFHTSMLRLTSALNDSHVIYTNEFTQQFFGEKFIASIFQLLDGKIVLTRPYNDAMAQMDDLQPGDIITHVDDIEVDSIIRRMRAYIPASNDTRATRPYSVFNGNTDNVRITFVRDGKTSTKTIHRYPFDEFNFLPYKLNDRVCHKRVDDRVKTMILDGDIGYLRLHALNKDEVDWLMTSMIGKKGVILDLRGHVQDNFIPQLLAYLNPEKTVFARFLNPDLSYPGRFVLSKDVSYDASAGKKLFTGKVAVLVDGSTISASEFLCMALQTVPGVTLIGSQTAGADGNVSRFSFLGKFPTMLTGEGVFYPDGRETQRVGIQPDIVVERTIGDALDETDSVLEKALEYLNE